MIENAFFFASVLLNATLAFFTAAIAMEVVFLLFRIKQHRIRASLRLIPYFSMVIDRIFNEFSLFNWLNPLSCNSCTQKFLLQLFFPHVHMHLDESNLSLVTYLATFNPQHVSEFIFIAFGIITLLMVVRTLFQALYQSRTTRELINKGQPCTDQITHPQLALHLKNDHVSILLSNAIQIPMAANSGTILIPKKLTSVISQEELEAIIAHEYAHLQWKDPYTRLGIALISAVFWWVPTQWWTKKVKQDQEMACDNNALVYHHNTDSLASALLKVVKETKNVYPKTLCSFADKANDTLERFHAMIGIPLSRRTISLGFIGMGLGTLLLVICMI